MRMLVLATFALVLIIGVLAQRFGARPAKFSLQSYTDFLFENDLLMTAEDLPEGTLLAGQFSERPTFDPGDLKPTVLFVDAEAAVSRRSFPIVFRNFTAENVYGSGTSFPCYRLVIVDGSRPRRSADEFPTLDFIVAHEFAHLFGDHAVDRMLEFAGDSDYLKFFRKGIASSNADEAIQALQASVDACPAFYPALDQLASLLARTGDLSEAVALYQRSLELNPANEIAAQNIIPVLLRDGQLEAAKRQLASNIQRNNESAENPYWAGVIAVSEGKSEAAFKAFGKARILYEEKGHPSSFEVVLYRLGLSTELDMPMAQPLAELAEVCVNVRLPPELSRICSLTDTEKLEFAMRALAELDIDLARTASEWRTVPAAE